MPPLALQPFARILFICMGNICRSPSAEGVFRGLAERAGLASRLLIDSAGTHHYHIGEPPDPRAQDHARRRGYELCDLRARQVVPEDFARFDLLLAMDRENLAALQALCPPAYRHKLRRLMEFARHHTLEIVPDPYYGPPAGFEAVLDHLEDACAGLLEHLVKQGLQQQEVHRENLTKKLGLR
ncbi:low molecular weight protein-tyrosine-phosphatase [Caldimonas brevitalea]|uniref:protein-tyrosine-phosphatase n=1 Tax=Caldimonas brevitalea TaxID=413882 RepID=A0A0G3BTR1_9BURK|nr:low molecular weight protein-tyrosine-phosphatase [Caldimonas brevitalea]AKJ29925.1 protein-tyrosine phosphatase [Caldimonas brevitalea]